MKRGQRKRVGNVIIGVNEYGEVIASIAEDEMGYRVGIKLLADGRFEREDTGSKFEDLESVAADIEKTLGKQIADFDALDDAEEDQDENNNDEAEQN